MNNAIALQLQMLSTVHWYIILPIVAGNMPITLTYTSIYTHTISTNPIT